MQRRSLLAVVPALFVAGCTSPVGDDGTESETSYEDTDFAVTAAECGTEREAASVSFDAEGATVTVEGTTSGPNACYAARLADANYDADADEFTLVVEAYREAGADGCAECIMEVDYEATASFAGEVPGSVAVVHASRGETREVATASP